MQKFFIALPNYNPKNPSTESLTTSIPLAASLSAYSLTVPLSPGQERQSLILNEGGGASTRAGNGGGQTPHKISRATTLSCATATALAAIAPSLGATTAASARENLPTRHRRRRSTAAAFFLPLREMDAGAAGVIGQQQRAKISLFRQYRNRQMTLSAGSNYHASRFASSDPPSDDGNISASATPLITKLDKYTNAELKEYRQIFNMFDTDRSGAIGIDELENAIQNLGLDPKQIDVEMLMREADKRGNQQIDFDEFCEVMKTTSEKTQSWNEVIKQCFDVFNRSETGFISLRDFEFVLHELGHFHNTRLIEEIFAEFDVNNDRIIDFDEFSFLVKSYLTDEDVY